MARFDPNTYPDRLVFEAQARRVRAQEIDRFFAATWAWLLARTHALAGGAADIGAAAHRPSQLAR
jgi:hypothetical protein